MKKLFNTYSAPQVWALNVTPEKGFAASGEDFSFENEVDLGGGFGWGNE